MFVEAWSVATPSWQAFVFGTTPTHEACLAHVCQTMVVIRTMSHKLALHEPSCCRSHTSGHANCVFAAALAGVCHVHPNRLCVDPSLPHASCSMRMSLSEQRMSVRTVTLMLTRAPSRRT